MSLIHIENKIDVAALAKVIRQEKQYAAIECLRIIRRTFVNYNMFAKSDIVRDITLFFEINLDAIGFEI